MDDFKYDIREQLGVISTNERTQWTTEVNVIAWNGNTPKLDIRAWSPDHTKMAKGMTFTEEESRRLLQILSKRLGR